MTETRDEGMTCGLSLSSSLFLSPCVFPRARFVYIYRRGPGRGRGMLSHTDCNIYIYIPAAIWYMTERWAANDLARDRTPT